MPGCAALRLKTRDESLSKEGPEQCVSAHKPYLPGSYRAAPLGTSFLPGLSALLWVALYPILGKGSMLSSQLTS